MNEVGCREVVLIHPGRRSRRKTDRRDAAKLSELLWLNGERLKNGQKPQGLRRVVIPTADDQADRQRTALRKRVGQQRTRSITKEGSRMVRFITGQMVLHVLKKVPCTLRNNETLMRTTGFRGLPCGRCARPHNEISVPGTQARTLVRSDSEFTKGWSGG